MNLPHFLATRLAKLSFLFSLILCCAATFNQAFAQKVDPVIQQQARQELQRRGVDEAAVRVKLQARGIDIDNVTQEQLPTLQPTIEAVIKEVEAEKAAAAQSGTPPPATTESVVPADTLPVFTEVSDTLRRDSLDTDTTAVPTLEVYGQSLFRDQSLSLFKASADVKPPDTYIVGTGDVLTVSIFGASQFDSRFEVGRDGGIQPSGMPRIFLRGLRLDQAKALLQSRFSQFYVFRPEQFAVSISSGRSITVNIFGETRKYGSFTISAVNTAFNALVAAGGPTELGSVRNINLIRGRTTKRLDVYELMKNPAIQYDFFLENNDIIHVPVAERIISIRGAINRPFRYELIRGENLVKLIEYAGGLTASAYREVVQVRRFDNDRQVLIDVNLSSLINGKQDFDLRNGDEVIVRSITAPIKNTATIAGAVELPGAYSLTDTRRVSDLLRKGVLQREARTDVAFLLRVKPDRTNQILQLDLDRILAAPGSAVDPELQTGDQLTIYTLSRFTDRSTISITGAVRAPLEKYPYAGDSTITLQRALLLAGGLTPDANGVGYILRVNPNNTKEKQYIKVDLRAALADATAVQNIVLQPFDQLQVLSQLAYSDATTINITGAVRRPGRIPYGQSMTLQEAIIFAGGFKLEAALNRVDVFRVEIKENLPTRTIVNMLQVDSNFFAAGSVAKQFALQPFDEIVVRTVPEFEFQHFVEIQGEVKYPGRYALISNNERLSDLILRAGGLSPEAFAEGASLLREKDNKGYVVTNLQEVLVFPNSPHNHILKEGDVLTIPKRLDLVSIRLPYTRANELYAERYLPFGVINAAYTPGKRAGWYIREYAAGFDKQARRTKVTVLNPSGKINRTSRFLFIKFYPKVKKGAIISVGGEPKPIKVIKEKKGIDWDKALTQILATAGTMATVLLAIQATK